MKLRLALLVVLALLLAACGDAGGPSAPTPGEMAILAANATSTPDETLAPVIAAREDLAVRFDLAPEEVAVLSVTPKEWPDTCLDVTYLGQEDEVCAQVVTPGYEVVLRLEDNIFTYHTDQEGAIVRFADVDTSNY